MGGGIETETSCGSSSVTHAAPADACMHAVCQHAAVLHARCLGSWAYRDGQQVVEPGLQRLLLQLPPTHVVQARLAAAIARREPLMEQLQRMRRGAHGLLNSRTAGLPAQQAGGSCAASSAAARPSCLRARLPLQRAQCTRTSVADAMSGSVSQLQRSLPLTANCCSNSSGLQGSGRHVAAGSAVNALASPCHNAAHLYGRAIGICAQRQAARQAAFLCARPRSLR